jgi:hypothetical protein
MDDMQKAYDFHAACFEHFFPHNTVKCDLFASLAPQPRAANATNSRKKDQRKKQPDAIADDTSKGGLPEHVELSLGVGGVGEGGVGEYSRYDHGVGEGGGYGDGDTDLACDEQLEQPEQGVGSSGHGEGIRDISELLSQGDPDDDQQESPFQFREVSPADHDFLGDAFDGLARSHFEKTSPPS